VEAGQVLVLMRVLIGKLHEACLRKPAAPRAKAQAHNLR
jgi:hypothetical protein